MEEYRSLLMTAVYRIGLSRSEQQGIMDTRTIKSYQDLSGYNIYNTG